LGVSVSLRCGVGDAEELGFDLCSDGLDELAGVGEEAVSFKITP